MAGRRHHVVLIPGFAGFDALGQLEYYAGVTAVFGGRDDAVLHYFDNFPTAAVATRAGRLRAYLTKRFARGEIADGDTITLIGHSTGGLDIRALLWSLHRAPRPMVVDGGAKPDTASILDAIRGVVFLSVPHWGTNIADWVRSYPVWHDIVMAELRAAFSSSQLPMLNRVGSGASGAAARLTSAGLFRAVEDCLREADPRRGRPGVNRLAEAHEAASQLDLYLRHMATDFHAIDDLTAAPPAGDRSSPAHFTDSQREEEQRLWRTQGIEVRSYVTLGPRPFAFPAGQAAPLWELSKPWTGCDILRRSTETDLVYRACYRACAGGPFTPPPGGLAPSSLETWDNDGIVNTASMYWPLGDHVLVHADHMDIVGHFTPARDAPGSARRFRSYDLLGSGSAFDAPRFSALWTEILDWAVELTATTSSTSASVLTY